MADDPTRTRAAFDVPARAYQSLIGRYLPTLAPAFADAAGVRAGRHVLDVGCGPGGLTTELVRRVGTASVAAIDPSEPFVAACRDANPGVDVRTGVAEQLPYDDAAFDLSASCLVVGFMTDAVAGVREMARVTRPGGTVALCFWNYQEMPVLRTLTAAAASIDPAQEVEARRLGTRSGDLLDLLTQAGISQPRQQIITAESQYTGFDDWWSPIPAGVGPFGVFYRSLTPEQQDVMRARCAELIGAQTGPFELTAQAWFAAGEVS